MHVASGDRFVSFKVGEDRKDDSFFFYRAVHDYCFLSCMWPQVIDLFPSKQTGIAVMAVSFSIARGIAWPEGRSDPKKKSHQKIVLLLFFLVIGEC